MDASLDNPKSILSQWAPRNGQGDFKQAFNEEFYTTPEGHFVCRITYKKENYKVDGDPSTGKHKTMLSAAAKMLHHVVSTVGDSKPLTKGIYKSRLTDWCRKKHKKQFDQVFTSKTTKNQVDEWTNELTHNETGTVFIGRPSKSKKDTEFDSCRQMWDCLEKGKLTSTLDACGPTLKYEALMGDKTLDYILGLAYYERTKDNADAAQLHDLITSRSNNDRLRERMEELGLERTGNSIMDASRVEQLVWKIHCECGFDPHKTLARLDPLLR